MNDWQVRSQIEPAVIVLVVLLSFIPAILSLQQAFADEYLLTDQESCKLEPLSGNWDEVSTTCFVEGFTLEFGDILDISSGITLQNNGMISNNGGIIDNHGILSNADKIDNEGTINNHDTINNEGTIDNDNGIIENTGSINNLETIRNDGTINNLFGGVINNDDTLDNFSTIINLFGGTINNSYMINNHGVVDNSCNFDNGGTINNHGTINNAEIFNNPGMIDNFCTGIINGPINGNQPIDLCGQPIVANSQTIVINEDTQVHITLTGSSHNEDDILTFAIVDLPSNGSLAGGAPHFVYTPNSNFFGTDSFTFTASNGTVNSNPATVMILVIAIDDPPTAVDDAVMINEDETITIDVIANDGDIDMNDDTAVISVSDSENGVTIIAGYKTITYTPNANFYGSDSFRYVVSDVSGSTAEATVWININPINDPPVANDQNVVTNEDMMTSISLSATDAEQDDLSYLVTSQPSHGTLTGSAPNLQYIPAANYFGPDSFTFEVSDSDLTDSATVSITVNPVNNNPEALDDVATTSQGIAVTIDVLDNDGDIDDPEDSLSVESVTTPANGVAVVNSDNTITYTPAGTFVGTDSFTYTISDGNGGTATATVIITVKNPLPPVEEFCGVPIDSFDNVIDGTSGNDKLFGTNGDDLIRGFGGNDIIVGGNGDDCIIGGDGNDKLWGGNGDDMIEGGSGNDLISGGNGDDVINGGDGNDTIYGKNSDDTLAGGSGNDQISDSNGNDNTDGGAGTDNCYDKEGRNTVVNCEGNKTIKEKNDKPPEPTKKSR